MNRTPILVIVIVAVVIVALVLCGCCVCGMLALAWSSTSMSGPPVVVTREVLQTVTLKPEVVVTREVLQTVTPKPEVVVTKEAPVPTSQDLVGSRWHMVYEGPISGHTEYDFTFRSAGKLDLHNPRDTTPDNDAWELNGTKITLMINDSYAVYEGQLSGRDFMSGTAKNKKAYTWDWEARRVSN